MPLTMTSTPESSTSSIVAPQRVGPARIARSPFERESERLAHPRGGFLPRRCRKDSSDPTYGSGVEFRPCCELAIPLLTLLAEEDGVEQVCTRTEDGVTASAPEIRNRQCLDWWLREAGSTQPEPWTALANALKLLQRWVALAGQPTTEVRAPRAEIIGVRVSTLDRPAQNVGIDLDPEWHRHILPTAAGA